MQRTMLVLLIVLWLCFGSFGTVLLTRLWQWFHKKTIEGLLIGKSKCPKCQTTLRRKNLIPLVSFWLQKWKCHSCKSKISWLYPVAEIASAAIFVLTYFFVNHFLGGSLVLLIFWLLVNRLLVMIIVYDILKFELHIPMRVALLIVMLGVQFVNGSGDYQIAFWASLLFWGCFYLIYFGSKRYIHQKYGVKKEGVGEWDAMMAFLLWAGMSFVMMIHHIEFSVISLVQLFLVFLVLSSLLGILFVLVQKLLIRIPIKKMKLKNKSSLMIPFLPAMITAFWVLLICAWSFKFIISPTLW